MTTRRRQDPVTPYRPGDMAEPVKPPRLIREWHVGHPGDVANMVLAADALGFDVTVDSYHAPIDNKGTTQRGYHVRLWAEQVWSACMLPRESEPGGRP